VHEPFRAASITEAALFQSIETFKPTLLIDELDAIFSIRSERSEALRGVLNAGNSRNSFVIRGTQDGTPVKFEIFGPKVLAGIANGKLPDTLRDRCIVIKMERKRRGDETERLRPADLELHVTELRMRLDDWAAEHVERLAAFRLAEPLHAVSDRLEEGWEPLLAIADLAGDGWPARARAAAAGLAGGTNDLDDEDQGIILLAALRKLFGDNHVIASAAACEKLNADDELPFGDRRAGQGIDQRGLSRLLRPYGIKAACRARGDSHAAWIPPRPVR
jgi:putative DNA primase/helicase